jgi:hypothetical protein
MVYDEKNGRKSMTAYFKVWRNGTGKPYHKKCKEAICL